VDNTYHAYERTNIKTHENQKSLIVQSPHKMKVCLDFNLDDVNGGKYAWTEKLH
jgi:hypothetical protein